MATTQLEQPLIEAVIGKQFEAVQVLNNESVVQTTSEEIDIRNSDQVALHVASGAGVSGGVITLEASPISGYAGTWLSLGTITANAASKLFGVGVGIGSITGFPIRFVRARISTVISGGTIKAYIAIQK